MREKEFEIKERIDREVDSNLDRNIYDLNIINETCSNPSICLSSLNPSNFNTLDAIPEVIPGNNIYIYIYIIYISIEHLSMPPSWVEQKQVDNKSVQTDIRELQNSECNTQKRQADEQRKKVN